MKKNLVWVIVALTASTIAFFSSCNSGETGSNGTYSFANVRVCTASADTIALKNKLITDFLNKEYGGNIIELKSFSFSANNYYEGVNTISSQAVSYFTNRTDQYNHYVDSMKQVVDTISLGRGHFTLYYNYGIYSYAIQGYLYQSKDTIKIKYDKD